MIFAGITNFNDSKQITKLQQALEEGYYLAYTGCLTPANTGTPNQPTQGSDQSTTQNPSPTDLLAAANQPPTPSTITSLPPILTSLIARKVRIQENLETIRIGDIDYQFSQDFCLLIFTKNASILTKSDYLIKCEILNFGIYEQGLEEKMVKVILQVKGGEAEKARLENQKFLLERINKMKKNQDIILKRLNKHNDYTLLDDLEFVEVLKSSDRDNEKINKEIELRKVMKEKLKDQRTHLNDLTKLCSFLFYTLHNMDAVFRGARVSAQLFLRVFQRLVSEVKVHHISEYNTQEVKDELLEGLFSVLTKGVPEQLRVFFGASISVKTSKLRKTFSGKLWNYVVGTPKKSTGIGLYGGQDSESGEIGGVWANIRKLGSMIPHLAQDDLQKLTEAFKVRDSQNFETSVERALGANQFNKFSPIEKLAICKAFIPENFLTALKIFSEFTNPKMLNSPRFKDLASILKFAEFDEPVVCYLDKPTDMAALSLNLRHKLQREFKLLFCGNISFSKCRRILEKYLNLGGVVVLSDVHLGSDWQAQICEWIKEVHVRIEERKKAREGKAD